MASACAWSVKTIYARVVFKSNKLGEMEIFLSFLTERQINEGSAALSNSS